VWPAGHNRVQKFDVTQNSVSPALMAPFLDPGAVLLFAKGANHDRSERQTRSRPESGRGIFALAKTATSPFMRAYCQRVAERYLSSHGELKSLKRPDNVRH
jgi:hypothetical protein